jgi:hypothetical protein
VYRHKVAHCVPNILKECHLSRTALSFARLGSLWHADSIVFLVAGPPLSLTNVLSGYRNRAVWPLALG